MISARFSRPRWLALSKYASRWTYSLLTTTRAKRIVFFGSGTSTAVAHDAINTFFHFNVMIIYSDNIVIQHINRMRCSENDLMMLLSHNVRTKNLVELAHENDTIVLNIAATCSPLTHKTTFALLLDVLENTDIYMLMASQLTRLTPIEALFTGSILCRSPKFRDNLKRIKDTLKESRFDKARHFYDHHRRMLMATPYPPPCH